MRFSATRNHRISLADALIMTRRYRRSVPKAAVHAFCFPRKVYEEILAQAGCEGIRGYLGAHEDGKVNLILVGVDLEMHDMIPGNSAKIAGDDEDGELRQDSYPCPVFCDDGSALNQD